MPLRLLVSGADMRGKHKRGGQRMTWRRRIERIYRSNAFIPNIGRPAWNFSWAVLKRKARNRQAWKLNGAEQVVPTIGNLQTPANRSNRMSQLK